MDRKTTTFKKNGPKLQPSKKTHHTQPYMKEKWTEKLQPSKKHIIHNHI